MKKTLVLLIAFLILSSSAWTSTYYIDPSAGSDGTGTIESPFKYWSSVTWAAGNSYLQKCGTTAYESHSIDLCPGETEYSIEVPGPNQLGMYWGLSTCVINVTASGTQTSPIYIGSYGTGSKPIITGQNTSTGILDVDCGIVVFDQSYVYISGLEIKYCRLLPIVFEAYYVSAGYNRMYDCYVHHCGMGGWFVGGNHDTGAVSIGNNVKNCKFEYMSFGFMPMFQTQNNVIESSSANYCDTHGFSCFGNYFTAGFNTGNIFRRLSVTNQMVNNPAWEAGQSYTAGESRVTVDGHGKYICIQSHTSNSGNAPPEGRTADPDVFVNDYWYAYAFTWWMDEGAGIQLDDLTYYGTVDSCFVNGAPRGIVLNRSPYPTIINNYISNSTEAGILITRQGTPEIGPISANIYNNTIVTSSADGIVGWTLSASDTINIKNNIFINCAQYGLSLPTNPIVNEDHNSFYNNADGNYSGHTLAATDTTSNPLLSGCYLGASSPCLNAGTTVSANANDINSISRPQGSEYDIGCYESPSNITFTGGFSGTAGIQ